jgi:hypothetical protein
MNHQTDAVRAVRDFCLRTRDKGQYPKESDLEFDIVIVAESYVLGHEKYWITTTLPDGKYYECTYDTITGKMYLDVYVRVHNEARYVGGV